MRPRVLRRRTPVRPVQRGACPWCRAALEVGDEFPEERACANCAELLWTEDYEALKALNPVWFAHLVEHEFLKGAALAGVQP